jgi:predicted porin
MKQLLAAVVFLVVAHAAGAQSAVNIDGKWDAQMNTPGGVRPFGVEFKNDNGKVSGTVHRTAGDAKLEGTLKGDALEFWYTIDYNGNPLQLTMRAKVTGDTMKGTVTMGMTAEDEFSAKRAALAAKP